MKFKFPGRSPAEMPFLDHLEELRWRILWSLLALVAGAIIGFIIVMQFDVIGVLKRPLDPFVEGGKLMYLSPTDPFFITLKLALAVGFLLAAPIIIYQAWAFFSPALLPREKRTIVPALYLGLVLFAIGVTLGYFLALPMSMKFFLGFQVESLQANITAGHYFAFVTKMLLAFGVMFELPVVILILSALGLVTSNFLRSKRRYAIAGMAILASVITPGDAITVTILLMGPLLLLYELSIALCKLVERGRARDQAADALPEAT